MSNFLGNNTHNALFIADSTASVVPMMRGTHPNSVHPTPSKSKFDVVAIGPRHTGPVDVELCGRYECEE